VPIEKPSHGPHGGVSDSLDKAKGRLSGRCGSGDFEMANEEHVEKQGVDAWNTWRRGRTLTRCGIPPRRAKMVASAKHLRPKPSTFVTTSVALVAFDFIEIPLLFRSGVRTARGGKWAATQVRDILRPNSLTCARHIVHW
jgi:hypothetical protein